MDAVTVADPDYWPQVERGIADGMDHIARDLVAEARRRAGWSSTVRRKVHAEVKRDARGPYITFSTGSSQQNIAENPKGRRHTRSGANRGTMPQIPVMKPAHDAVLAKGGLEVRF